MNNPTSRAFQRLAAVTVVAAALMSGCATPPPPPPPPAPVVAPPPEPVAPPAPELTPAQSKSEAQKLALQAVDSLQNGDETTARTALEKAVVLDPSNDLAKKLLDQIKADAQAELGSTFFRYTVQRDDSLSKLAQTYLGDRFRFYILAKYNEISNPSRLSAGQVIKIPGKGPIAPPVTARPAPTKPPETVEVAPKPSSVPVPEPEPVVKDTALLQKGNAQQKSGDLAGAYASYSEAVRNDPNNRDAVRQRDMTRTALIRQYDREAAQAYQRQNLDLAIKKWDQILELDPGNQKAKLERERAIDLKKRMNEKFGTK
jgi:tetratricopeptide (TPR) repeat protein